MAVSGYCAFLVACRVVVGKLFTTYACQWLTNMHATALAADETGLVRLEQPEGTSSCSETYVCTTTGGSEVVLKFDGQVIFQRSHSQYATDSGMNVSVDDVTIVNLLRSPEADVCHDVLRNTSDYCYNTTIVVHLTQSTTCRVLECTTSTFIDSMNRVLNFGNGIIAENSKLLVYFCYYVRTIKGMLQTVFVRAKIHK